jgi:hypothetical protein
MTSGPGELVGLPEGGPTSRALVKVQLSIAADDTRDDDRLDAIVAAVNNLVRGMRVSEAAVGATEWPAKIVQGATMLAARLFRRKNSPAGVEAFGQLGGAYVMRNDPDIAQLLQLGTYQSPQIG